MTTPFKRNRFAKSDGKPVKKRPRTAFEKQVSRLDSYFSLYVRLSNMDSDGMCTCYTCGVKKTWDKRKTSAGHFIGKHPTKYLRTRWDERNVKPQCYNCNTNKEGEQFKFSMAIDAEYGTGTAMEINIKSTKHFNPLLFDMEKSIAYYREKVRYIKQEHGIK